MRLKKLYIKNLRSYEEQELEFPQGALLLCGNVGSGKTTILLAIEYALFGLQAGQRGAALLRNNEDEAEVKLEIDVEGKNIIIERKMKKDSKSSITSDYSALTINGEKVEYSTTELKTKLLEILGYPQEFVKKNNLLYKYTVYTPQELMKQIILEDSQTRISVIRHVFGIDKYRIMRDNLNILSIHIKDEAKVLQGEVKSIDFDKTLLQTAKDRIIVLQKDINECEGIIVKRVAERKEIEKEAKKVEEKIKQKEQFEKEIEKTNILITAKKESIFSLELEEKELKQYLSESGKQFNQSEYTQTLANLAAKKALIESLNASYFTLLNNARLLDKESNELKLKKDRFFSIKICPTCLQDVMNTHRHNILNESEAKLSENKKQKIVLEEELVKIQKQISEEKVLLVKLEHHKTELESIKSKSLFLEKSRKKLEEVSKNIQNLNKDLSLLSEHNNLLKEQVLKLSATDSLAKKKTDDLKLAFIEEKKAEINKAELNKELELTKRDIENLNNTIVKKEESNTRLIYLQELADWLSKNLTDLINYMEIQVLMKLRLEFSKLFGMWFTMITGDSFEVRLDENFTPLIIQNGVEMDYSFLSGGERTAVALAYRLALNQTINSLLSTIKTKDLIILDEPTDGFSEAQIDKIRDVLQQLNAGQLILVSHEQKIESFVDHVIKVQKEGNISSIIKE